MPNANKIEPLARIILITLAIHLGFTTVSVADDWPQWRGPNRNGISKELNWSHAWGEAGPKVLWKSDIGIGFSSVVVSDGRVYSVGNSDDTDTIVCLDALTGNHLWKHSYPCPLDDRFFEGGPTSTPTIDGQTAFVLSRTGDLSALNATSGEIRWAKNLPEELGIDVPGWGFAGSPLVVGELLIVSVGQSGTAIDKKSGDVVWQSSGEAGYMTPLPIKHEDNSSLIIASGKHYYQVDLATGDVQWKHRWLTTFGCNAADPIFIDGRVFISSGYNRGSALLKTTEHSVEVVWETKEFQNQWSSSILVGDFLYGVDGNDTGERPLKCVDLRTGSVRWSYDALGSASLMAAGDRLIILSDQGELVIAETSPEEFRPLARAKVLSGKCWTVPVLAHGLLYCRNAAGELVCLDLRKH